MHREPKTIVVITADDAIADRIGEALRGETYRMTRAQNAIEGTRLLKDAQADLIMLDPHLPGASARAILDSLRAQHYPIPLFIIAKEVDAFAWIAEYQIAGLVVQPIDPPILLRHVGAALELEEASISLEKSLEEVWQEEERSLEEDPHLLEEMETNLAPPEASNTTNRERDAPQSATAKVLALVVEEKDDLRQATMRELERMDFRVLLAHDGEEGLRSAQEHCPNLILLSATSSKLNGHQVCRLLKFNRKYRDIRIVITSAANDPEEERAAVRAGADGVLFKPFSPKALANAVREALLTPEIIRPKPSTET